mgnify:FL=1
MGMKSRRKGAGFEREVVHFLQDRWLAAERVPLSGAAGGSYVDDVTSPVRVEDKRFECKRRASGFKTLYGWLGSSYGVIFRDDHCEPLIVLRLEDFARLAK